MIFSQNDFEDAVDDAKSIIESSGIKRENGLVRDFKRDLKAPRLDTRQYVKTLLTAFLVPTRKLQVYRDRSQNAPKPSELFTCVFDVEPFSKNSISKDGSQSLEITINFEEALKPVKFRDYMRTVLATRVDIVSVKFGCLHVEYFVHSPDSDWKNHLRNSDEFEDICSYFNMRELKQHK